MFKSLISLFLSDILFPIVIVLLGIFFINFFPNHWFILTLISIVVWITIFPLLADRFDKYK